MRQLLLFSFIGFLSINTALAQYSETISSDRPGATYSANTLGSRVLQFQVGGDFVSNSFDNQWTERNLLGWQFDGMIRVGILERLEIGFPIAYRNVKQQNVTVGNSDPIENLAWGINLRGNVLQSNGKTPDIGMFVEVRFPDAEMTRFADGISQVFLLNISQPLEERITLSSSIGMARHSFADFVYTLNLNVSVSQRVSLFVEHYGAYRREYGPTTFANPEPKKYDFWYAKVNAGIAVLATDDFQLDVQGGYGDFAVAPYNSSDWYLGIGVSYRVRFKKRESKKENG